jgi:TetR/AcrR family transcriptional regulator, transcriptional repressor for nem operon
MTSQLVQRDKAVSIKISAKANTKAIIIQAGLDIMLEKGYSNTGIQEVLSTSGVPKGSFYHYFESKENFALEIIHSVQEAWVANNLPTLQDTEQTPLHRLRTYCDIGLTSLLSGQCRKGCLIGNLSQEMSDQSENLRTALSQIMTARRDALAVCIAEGQQIGEISESFSATELADLFDSGWSGAVMSAKTEKNIRPVEVFINLMFGHVLKANVQPMTHQSSAA